MAPRGRSIFGVSFGANLPWTQTSSEQPPKGPTWMHDPKQSFRLFRRHEDWHQPPPESGQRPHGHIWMPNPKESFHRLWSTCNRHRTPRESEQCASGLWEMQSAAVFPQNSRSRLCHNRFQLGSEPCPKGHVRLRSVQTHWQAHPCWLPPPQESGQRLHGRHKLWLSMALTHLRRPDLSSHHFGPKNEQPQRFPYRAAVFKGVIPSPLDGTSMAPASNSRMGSTCPSSAAWYRGVMPKPSLLFGLHGHFSNFSRLTVSLPLAATIIFSSSATSGGQNSKTTSWTFAGTEVKLHHLESQQHHLPERVFV